ncbi:hypothetical protein M501DRAFT_1001204 [Patellaria atrata CBS 101060]|uniref:Tautomerase cis-CaaD-like domain-containing protein n=1 Tax=Patellaria atrata CBS 101060 TaxID=1346257 RepID=A0A9P4S1C0_9PEZI|nr:hypothetical protein M501DRAFT_1001204 [Patellaria atrata CBS 101060]
MPVYEIHHCIDISDSQKDQLAEAITKLHSSRFTTPSLFVNVRFHDSSSIPHYVAGKRKSFNIIIVHLRPGPDRPRSALDALTNFLTDLWNTIMSPSSTSEKLHTTFLLNTIAGGQEAGFLLPEAGNDVEWVKDNLAEFEKRAGEKEEDIADLLDEVKKRKVFGLG